MDQRNLLCCIYAGKLFTIATPKCGTILPFDWINSKMNLVLVLLLMRSILSLLLYVFEVS